MGAFNKQMSSEEFNKFVLSKMPTIADENTPTVTIYSTYSICSPSRTVSAMPSSAPAPAEKKRKKNDPIPPWLAAKPRRC